MLREFVGDLGKSLGAWARVPMLPILTVAVQLPSYLGPFGIAYVLAFPLGIFYVGFVGTQRIWYMAAWNDYRMSPGEIGRLSLSYLPRFAALGILTMVPFMILYPFVAWGSGNGDPTKTAIIASVATTILWDVWLTFMTPALAFSTSRVTQAIPIGWRLLKRQWPRCAAYALFPPLAIQAVWLQARPDFDAREVPVAMTAATAMILANLAFKGATARFYLRHRRSVTADMELTWSGPDVRVPVNL